MTPAAGTQMGRSGDENDRQILDKIEKNTSVIAVKLFGSSDADDENGTGRLPKVEAKAQHAHLRIDKIERKIVWASGFGAGLGTLLSVMIEHVFK